MNILALKQKFNCTIKKNKSFRNLSKRFNIGRTQVANIKNRELLNIEWHKNRSFMPCSLQ